MRASVEPGFEPTRSGPPFASAEKWLPAGILGVALFLGAFTVYYPYFKSPELAGTDIRFYLSQLTAYNTAEAILKEIIFNRGLYLFLIFGIKSVTGLDAQSALKIGPIFLAWGLSLATYWFMWAATRDKLLGAYAALLSAFSPQTTVGMSTGIFANWLAMVQLMASYASYMEYMRSGSARYAAIASSLSVLMAITHPWTWGMLMASVALYAAMEYLLQDPSQPSDDIYSRAMRLASLIFYVNGAISLLAILAFPEFVQGIIATAQRIVSTLSVANIMNVVNSLRASPYGFTLTGLAAPLLLILSLGTYAASDFEHRFSRLLYASMMIPSIMAISMDAVFQWRLLYLLPYSISAVTGVFFLSRALLKHRPLGCTAIPRHALLRALGLSMMIAFTLAMYIHAIGMMRPLI